MEDFVQMVLILLHVGVNLVTQDRHVEVTLMIARPTLVKMEVAVWMD